MRRIVRAFALSYGLSLLGVLLLAATVRLAPLADLVPDTATGLSGDTDGDTPVARQFEWAADGITHLKVRACPGNVTVTAVPFATDKVRVQASRFLRNPLPDGYSAAEDQWILSWRQHDTIHVTSVQTRAVRHAPVGLHVTVPPQVAVEVRAARGDVSVSGVRQDVAVIVETAGGISIADCTGELSAQTTLGPVQVEAIGGETRIRTGNGDVLAAVREPGPYRVDIATVNGNLRLELPIGLGASLTGETSNGRITVPEGTGLSVSAPGGNRRILRGKIGNAAIAIRLHTVNGGIDVTWAQ